MREFRKWLLVVLVFVLVIGWNVGCENRRELIIDAKEIIKTEPPSFARYQINEFLGKILDRILQGTYNGNDHYFDIRVSPNTPQSFWSEINLIKGGIFTFTNKRLILAARNEAEFAFVIAHEIAHVVAPDFLPKSLWPGEMKGYKPGYSPRMTYDLSYRLFLVSFKHELIDQVGIELMAKANYDTYSAVSIMRLTIKEEGERRLSAYRNARKHFRNSQKKWILFTPEDLERIKGLCRKEDWN